ncbi:MAG TPA: hypothetical protein VGO56_10065 [Pyrinomonadaceae bacterium]|jgi:tetratricopeptide (TPR) repeat protein|nr:hypothetical protein [Pyrinomonadaceae bacterium]
MIVRLWICLCLLALASITPVCGQQSDKLQTHRLTLPNKDWSLDIALADFSVVSEEIKTTEVSKEVKVAGFVYDFLANQITNTTAANNKQASRSRLVMLTIHLEPAQSRAAAAEFRDSYMKKLTKLDAVDKNSVKAFDYGQIPLIRYRLDLAKLGLFAVNEEESENKGMNAFFVEDNVWITIGLSVKPFKKEDEQFFYSILASVKFVDNRTPSTSFDYYQLGRTLSLQSKRQESIASLRKALELERQQRQLQTTQWRNLVWSVMDAYRATGSKAGFDDALEYGISQDPAYYRFHLIVARKYAAAGDVEGAIASLENAFRTYLSDQTVHPGEWVEDPLSDPSFERIRKDERFRSAVKAMRKPYCKSSHLCLRRNGESIEHSRNENHAI